jgi:ankyrin repeat protein
LDYLLSNSRLNVLERNLNGETPLSIAQDSKNKGLIELLAKSENVFDETKKNTDELLDEVEKEEIKME